MHMLHLSALGLQLHGENVFMNIDLLTTKYVKKYLLVFSTTMK